MVTHSVWHTVLPNALLHAIGIDNSLYPEGPEVELLGTDGTRHDIIDYIGHDKWIIINVWSPQYEDCRDEIQELLRFHEQHAREDAAVVGLAVSYPELQRPTLHDVRDYVKEMGITYPILIGDAEVASYIGGETLHKIPMSYFFHPSGNLTARWPGALTKSRAEEVILSHRTVLDDWF